MKKTLLISAGLLLTSVVAMAVNSDIVTLTVTGSAVSDKGSNTVTLEPSSTKGVNDVETQIYLADPTVYTENGKYYMAGTRSWSPAGFTLLESDDMQKWRYTRPDSMMLIKDNSTYGNTGFWAPQIYKYNDKYLFAYTANEQTCVAEASKLGDVFTQPTVRAVDSSAKNIDPFIFRDDDGKYYFYHVRFGGGNYLWVAEFDPETCTLVPGTLKKCFSNTQAWEHTGAYPSDPIMEGPTVIKLDNTYYLFYSANHYMSPDYAVGYATAPSPMGPWTKNPNNPVFNRALVGERGPGHGDVFYANDGSMRYVYHVHNSDTKANPRRTRILTLNVDKSAGEPYNITADASSIIIPTVNPMDAVKGVFSGYVSLVPGSYTFTGTDANGNKVVFGNDNGCLKEGAAPFTADKNCFVRVVADTKTGALVMDVIDDVKILGTVAPANTILPYVGDGIWSGTVELNAATSRDYPQRYMYFSANGKNMKRVPRTNKIAFESEINNGENIRINNGEYTITIDMNERTFDIVSDFKPYRISVFGSSVANGTGAPSLEGYAYQFSNLLDSRYKFGRSEYPFEISGVSIGGNTTQNVLDRFDDMLRDNGKYVIVGLSMGNEGLHGSSNKYGTYTQFRNNMLKIIEQIRDAGKVPVIMNNYTHSDYNSTDYRYIRDINMDIHEWDVASVNTLGSIDDGTGKWAAKFVADAGHPNRNGHTQFMYAIVPSLFDAIEAGKPVPERNMGGELTLGENATLSFKPEENLNAFTICVRVKADKPGKLLQFKHGARANYTGTLSINADGSIYYKAPIKGTVEGGSGLLDGEYHNVILTHFYARGESLLYIDNKLVGTIAESLTPGTFTIGDVTDDPAQSVPMTFAEVSFWRAGLNADEIAGINNGKLLKSSLEIYTPLYKPSVTPGEAIEMELENKAQCLNAMTYKAPVSAGVGSVSAADSVAVGRYNAAGVNVSEDARGVQIVRYSDGTVRKEIH